MGEEAPENVRSIVIPTNAETCGAGHHQRSHPLDPRSAGQAFVAA